jgi:hypothetical protein
MPARRSQLRRHAAVNPVQPAKFTVVCVGAFDLKSKDVTRDIFPVPVLGVVWVRRPMHWTYLQNRPSKPPSRVV